jgi:hypothetical protein
VDVSHKQNGPAGVSNCLNRFAQLIAIPEVALLIKLNETQAINVLGRRAVGSWTYRGLSWCFAQMIGSIRGAAGEKKSERPVEEAGLAYRS